MTSYPASRNVPAHPKRVYATAHVPELRFPLRVDARETARNGVLLAVGFVAFLAGAAWLAA